MEFHFLPGQNYDCVRCAKGCTSTLRVEVDPYSQRVVSGSPVELRVIQQHGASLSEDPDGRVRTARQANGHCVFLGEDKLCAIHAEMGIEAKPMACRAFPFSITPTPDGYYVSVSYFCTSAQRNSGRPLAEHRAEVEEILKGIRFSMVGDTPLVVDEHRRMDWEAYKKLEAFLNEELSRPGRPEVAVARALTAVAEVDRAVIGAADLDISAAGDRITGNPDFEAQTAFLTAALVGFLEAAEPSATQALSLALLDGDWVELGRWGWSGMGFELQEIKTDEFDAEIKRYLKALLFGKFLTQRPLWLHLSLLYLLPELVRFYTALAARARDADEPEIEDFYRAMDTVELEIGNHARGIDPILAAVGSAYGSLLAVPGPA